MVYVDVNGMNKLPNTSGLDIFAFYVDKYANIKRKYDVSYSYGSTNNTYSSLKQTCYGASSTTESSFACFALVIYNNWKIYYL